MKEKIMQATSDYDLIEIENEIIEPIRNNFYNELLKDKEIEEHLCKIFKVDASSLQNVLVINGNPPLDYDDRY